MLSNIEKDSGLLSALRRDVWSGANPKKWARDEEAKRRIGEIGRSLTMFPERLELAILAAKCCASWPLSLPPAANPILAESVGFSRTESALSSASSVGRDRAHGVPGRAADLFKSSRSHPRRSHPLDASSFFVSTSSPTTDEVDLGVSGLEALCIQDESVVESVLVSCKEARVAVWILSYAIPAIDRAQESPTSTSEAGSGSPASADTGATDHRIRTIVTFFYHAASSDEAAEPENTSLGDWLSGADLTTIGSAFSQEQRHEGPRVHLGVYRMWRAVFAKVDHCLVRIRQRCENCPQQLILTGYGIGGSIASLAALELMETAIPRTWNQCQAYINSGTIESDVMPNFIVTFGSPPAGDSTFCTALDSSFCRWDARKLRTRPEKPGMQIEDYERNLRVIRFVKQCDLTPSIPGCLSIAWQTKTTSEFLLKNLPALVLYLPVSVLASVHHFIARACSGSICPMEEARSAKILMAAPQPGCLVWLRDSTTAGARLCRPTCLDIVHRTCLKAISRHRAHPRKSECCSAEGYLITLERLRKALPTFPSVTDPESHSPRLGPSGTWGSQDTIL